MKTRRRFLILLLLPLIALPLLAMSGTADPVEPIIIDAVIYTKAGERPLKLELAATPKTREIGLMKRQSLAPYDGMLFVFPEPARYGFWMKETKIPLDMIFISDKQTITDIGANREPYTLDPYIPPTGINAVIELDGGRAARESIAKGDKVRYALPTGITIK